MPYDLKLTGGLLCLPDGEKPGEVAVEQGKIVALGWDLGPAREEVDCTGCLVLPGLIDGHVHLDLAVKDTVTVDDYGSGSRAALRGGVTTVLTFVTPRKKENGQTESLQEALELEQQRAAGKCSCDYGFHLSLTNWPRHKEEIDPMIKAGYPTYKAYMIYGEQGWQADDAVLFEALEELKKHKGLLMVHAESASILNLLTRRYHRAEWMAREGARLQALSRPDYVEVEAIQRLLCWARATEGPLYVVHVSTAEGARRIQEARQAGLQVWGESCPQYLCLDDSSLNGEEGHFCICSPPLRPIGENEGLWQALREDGLSLAATDHCAFSREQKNRWQRDWTQAPNGLPGLETLLPLLYTEGVEKKRLALRRLVELVCENPARVYGLYPRKGQIAVGADGDLLVLDPGKECRFEPDKQAGNADWSPYGKRMLRGFPRDVWRRGEAMVRDYDLQAELSTGLEIPRALGQEG